MILVLVLVMALVLLNSIPERNITEDVDEIAPPREIRARIYFTDDLYDDAHELLGKVDGNRTFDDKVNSGLGEV